MPLDSQARYVFVALSRPQLPPDTSFNPMQWPLRGLHATPCPTSHCSLTEQAAPIGPGTGTKQIDVPFGHTVPALQAPLTQGLPAGVRGAHTPHRASGARAQKAVSHCRSSTHPAPDARAPGLGAQAAPRSPCAKAEQDCNASDSAQLAVSAAVAFDPGANRVRQSTTSRCSHTARVPKTRLVAKGVHVSALSQRARASEAQASGPAGSPAPIPSSPPPSAPPAEPPPVPPAPGSVPTSGELPPLPGRPPPPGSPPAPLLETGGPPGWESHAACPAIARAKDQVSSQFFINLGRR